MNGSPRTYADWFDFAALSRHCQRKFNKTYRDGVERAAALAAVETKDAQAAINAFCDTFDRFRSLSPRWDGSIA